MHRFQHRHAPHTDGSGCLAAYLPGALSRLFPVRRAERMVEEKSNSHACIDIMVVLGGGGWYGSDGRV